MSYLAVIPLRYGKHLKASFNPVVKEKIIPAFPHVVLLDTYSASKI